MGKTVTLSRTRNFVLTVLLSALIPGVAYADKTDDIVNRGKTRAEAAAASQKRIDEISEATDKIVSQYNQQAKIVEGLEVFNDRLRRTLTAQEVAVGKLEKSIEDASLIERQIVPLMMRMIEGLDDFVHADMPFQTAERNARIERIRGYLTNANISAAERFRQVLNAYQIENDYGKTVGIYTERMALPPGELTVNLLQVGRTGLYYQTLDGLQSGYWDARESVWKELDSSHNEGIAKAIRIVQDKEIPDLMELPIMAPEAR